MAQRGTHLGTLSTQFHRSKFNYILKDPLSIISFFQKLTGLSHMTDYGVLVSFPIFDVRSVAPEVLLQGLPKNTVPGSELQGDEEMDSIRKEHLHFLNA